MVDGQPHRHSEIGISNTTFRGGDSFPTGQHGSVVSAGESTPPVMPRAGIPPVRGEPAGRSERIVSPANVLTPPPADKVPDVIISPPAATRGLVTPPIGERSGELSPPADTPGLPETPPLSSVTDALPQEVVDGNTLQSIANKGELAAQPPAARAGVIDRSNGVTKPLPAPADLSRNSAVYTQPRDANGHAKARSAGDERRHTEVLPELVVVKRSELEVPRTPHRVVGELERNDPSATPLGPTPITDDARDRLLSWDIPDEYITGLQVISSSMRPDLSPLKAQQIAARGGYIFEGMGRTNLVLPDLLNFNRRLGGSCGEMSIQFLRLLHSSGYMRALDQVMDDQGKPRIEPYYFKGFARTHFTERDPEQLWSHMSNGLLPGGGKLKHLVTVDTSLHEISNTDTNGYKVVEAHGNPASISNQPVAAKINVAEAVVSKGRITFPDIDRPIRMFVLGSSPDINVVYQFSFVRNNTSGEISPFLVAKAPNDNSEPSCVRDSRGRLRFQDAKHLSDAHAGEMVTIYDNLADIRLRQDPAKAIEELRKTASVKFYTPSSR